MAIKTLCVESAWIQVPAVLYINFVTLEKLVHLVRLQFPHLYKGDHNQCPSH